MVKELLESYGESKDQSATLPSLRPLPKGADFDTFDTWRRGVVDKTGNTGGVHHVIFMSHTESLAKAIEMDQWGRTPAQIEILWKSMHFKACCILKEALREALSDSPGMEAQIQQKLNPSDFIENNANWLWEFATRQFAPDPIGRTVKAFKSLNSLRFVPGKSTPAGGGSGPGNHMKNNSIN